VTQRPRSHITFASARLFEVGDNDIVVAQGVEETQNERGEAKTDEASYSYEVKKKLVFPSGPPWGFQRTQSAHSVPSLLA
jgi:hypothetical protein